MSYSRFNSQRLSSAAVVEKMDNHNAEMTNDESDDEKGFIREPKGGTERSGK